MELKYLLGHLKITLSVKHENQICTIRFLAFNFVVLQHFTNTGSNLHTSIYLGLLCCTCCNISEGQIFSPVEEMITPNGLRIAWAELFK